MSGSPIPVISLMVSVACTVPTIPGSTPNTPPSAQFGAQEFADDQQIQKFCKANYGVSFPMFGRGSVKGADASPFYKQLIAKTGEPPAWNFNKYLIGRDGKVRKHFSSDVTPDAATLIKQIEAELAASAH